MNRCEQVKCGIIILREAMDRVLAQKPLYNALIEPSWFERRVCLSRKSGDRADDNKKSV
jgi:hypothetical protein